MKQARVRDLRYHFTEVEPMLPFAGTWILRVTS
jgi:hypothetical protein